MKIKYLPLKKAKALEESIGWLSNYTTPEDEEHMIGESLEQKDEISTTLLHELGRINLKRQELIKLLTNE